ncbi:hypothetical protein BJY24_007663 [Nocardia transvalensis]|uniref:PE domain-containing protein n=1 Tax=Nocardia transvalensis TaxID=37333 RepID=A0A7W9UML2_9NOCA|nr:PE domain-containing protein [Nocardia transvalensis]MBB5918751.1 hypothetical protein [Nocardia transvalensis]
MILQVDSDHLTAIATRMGMSSTELMAALSGAVPGMCPLPAAFDDVSMLVPQVMAEYASSFGGVTAHGIEVGATGGSALPVTGQCYSGEDILSGETIAAQGVSLTG